jgi:hypothetical protein
MKAHPHLQDKPFHLGNIRSGGDYEATFTTLQTGSRPRLPLGFYCPDCTNFEYVANVSIEKLYKDAKNGILPSEQPFKLPF